MKFQIQHINNKSNAETTCSLIKYDSVHGRLNANVDFDDEHLIINNKKITFTQMSSIDEINWKKFDVDYVFECTGKFNSKEKLLAHIKNEKLKYFIDDLLAERDKYYRKSTITIECNDLKKEEILRKINSLIITG